MTYLSQLLRNTILVISAVVSTCVCKDINGLKSILTFISLCPTILAILALRVKKLIVLVEAILVAVEDSEFCTNVAVKNVRLKNLNHLVSQDLIKIISFLFWMKTK